MNPKSSRDRVAQTGIMRFSGIGDFIINDEWTRSDQGWMHLIGFC